MTFKIGDFVVDKYGTVSEIISNEGTNWTTKIVHATFGRTLGHDQYWEQDLLEESHKPFYGFKLMEENDEF